MRSPGVRPWARSTGTARAPMLLALLSALGGASVSYADGSVRALPVPARGAVDARDGIVALRADATDRVLVPAGRFTMGSDAEELERALLMCRAEPAGVRCASEVFAREYPAHEVQLGAFALHRREVTVAQYRRCVDAGGCAPAWFGAAGKRYDVDDLPVTMVSWFDASDYCAWVGGRLPTEAEWERAARGVRGRRFPWGDVFNRFLLNGGRSSIDAFDDRDGFLELAPVGSFPEGRTPDGIDDLAGNVDEWVADYFGDYALDPAVDPTGPVSGEERVYRGGTYTDGAPYARGAARRFDLPWTRRPWIGFRCAFAPGGR